MNFHCSYDICLPNIVNTTKEKAQNKYVTKKERKMTKKPFQCPAQSWEIVYTMYLLRKYYLGWSVKLNFGQVRLENLPNSVLWVINKMHFQKNPTT